MKNYFLATALFLGAMNGAFPASSATDADGDGLPDATEPVLGTDPMNADTDGDGSNDLADKSPLSADNPIPQTGKANALTFTAKVEDNFDAVTKKDAPDHLELDVKNTSGEALKDLSLFYSIKDVKTGKSEAYFKPLTGLVIEKGKSAAVNVDTSGLPGHFRSNPNSSYYISQNAKTFTIQLAVPGFAPVTVELKKDAGGAEQPD